MLRDLFPGVRNNRTPDVLLNSDGLVKLTDFGIGRRLKDAHSGLSAGETEQV